MISEGQEAWEDVAAGGRGSEMGVFLTDSGEGAEGFTDFQIQSQAQKRQPASHSL